MGLPLWKKKRLVRRCTGTVETDGYNVPAFENLYMLADVQTMDNSVSTGLDGDIGLQKIKVFTDCEMKVAYLIPGDIVLAEAHHVVINVSTGSKVTTANGNGKGDAVRQYAGIVKVSSYLNVRLGPGTRFGTVKLGGQEMRLPPNMVVSIDKETEGWGRLTGTGYWVSLQYIQK